MGGDRRVGLSGFGILITSLAGWYPRKQKKPGEQRASHNRRFKKKIMEESRHSQLQLTE